MNADGLIDLMYVRYSSGGGNQSISHLNTGRGWMANPSPEWKIPDSAFVADAVTTDGQGDHGIRIMDINGDGLVDILHSYRHSKDNVTRHAWVNNGMTWVEKPNFTPCHW